MPASDIIIKCAREHNLRDVNLVLPRNQLICLTGVSGSGKSSLAFDTLYAEGARTPRMMSVGLHCRLAGRPGRFLAVERFIDHALRHEGVWFCRRIDIARHWRQHHPAHRDS